MEGWTDLPAGQSPSQSAHVCSRWTWCRPQGAPPSDVLQDAQPSAPQHTPAPLCLPCPHEPPVARTCHCPHHCPLSCPCIWGAGKRNSFLGVWGAGWGPSSSRWQGSLMKWGGSVWSPDQPSTPTCPQSDLSLLGDPGKVLADGQPRATGLSKNQDAAGLCCP